MQQLSSFYYLDILFWAELLIMAVFIPYSTGTGEVRLRPG